MTVFGISAPLEREDALADLAVQHGHRVALRAAHASEMAEKLKSIAVDAVLVAAHERHLDSALVQACDRLGVRVIVVADDRAEQARATALGVESVRFADGFTAVEYATSVLEQSSSRRARGNVVAIWGPHGSPGRSTVAVSIAAELVGLGLKVAIVDADVHGASIAPTLGLVDDAPGIAAAARLVRTQSLTTDELDRIAHLHESSQGVLRVLTGISRQGRWPELAPDRIAGVLDACRDWVDWTIVDVAAPLEADEDVQVDVGAPRRNAATFAALREADTVLVVGVPDTIGMTRLLHAYPQLLEHVPAERVRVIMNKVRTSAMGVGPVSSTEQTLARLGGIRCAFTLPFDTRAADAALLAGRPLGDVAGRSKLRKSVKDVALSLVPPQSRAEKRQAVARRRFMPRPVH